MRASPLQAALASLGLSTEQLSRVAGKLIAELQHKPQHQAVTLQVCYRVACPPEKPVLFLVFTGLTHDMLQLAVILVCLACLAELVWLMQIHKHLVDWHRELSVLIKMLLIRAARVLPSLLL